MTRQQYIEAAKAKLEEISPFDEPSQFIAASADPDYKDVKPIVSYIESELDNAGRFCLNSLPLPLLAEDIFTDDIQIGVDNRGVGHILNIYEYMRLVRVACREFQRDITAFISSSSPNYLIQQNKYTRGGYAKPVAAYVPDRAEIEVYSFANALADKTTSCRLSYIDVRTKAESIHSRIEEYIVIRTAMNVMRILGDDQAVERLAAEFNEMLATIQN